MSHLRIGMVAVTFFVSAALASAQSISIASHLAAVEAAVQQSTGPECSDCDVNWYVRALQHGATAWQRVRAICTPNQSCGSACSMACPVLGVSKGPGAAAGTVKGWQVHHATPTTGTFTFGICVGSDKGICGSGVCNETKQAAPLTCPLGFTSAPCCCSKACACCETCKAKVTTARVQAVPAMPMAMPHPVAPPVQTWTMPVPPPPGARAVVGLPTSNVLARPAQFVTPELEAHCQRITHRDGQVILEGNVMLVSKKHVQPMRIEAQRVIINMRDGSFTVDSNVMAPVGVMRTAVELPAPTILPAPVAPVQYRVIEVSPR